MHKKKIMKKNKLQKKNIYIFDIYFLLNKRFI